MLPLSPGIGNMAVPKGNDQKSNQQKPNQQKEVQPEEPPCVPAAAPSPPHPPSLESQMLALRVQAALPQEPNMDVSHEQFSAFLAFCANWSKQPSNNFLWGNFSTYQEFVQTAAKSDIPGMLKTFFEQYMALKNFKGSQRDHARLKSDFVQSFWNLCTIFILLCERDAHSFESVMRDASSDYRRHYSSAIHPHYMILQRFANFILKLSDKEVQLSEDKMRGVLSIGPRQRLGFFFDKENYVPIPFAHNPDELEIIYLHYGQALLPSHKQRLTPVFIFDKSQFVTSSGFLVEIKKLPSMAPRSHLSVLCRGFFGEGTFSPFCVTDGLLGSPQMPEFANLYDLLEDEIEAFKRQKKRECDTFFLPFPSQKSECDDFAYCFLLELIERTKDQTDSKGAEEAQKMLQHISELEGMPAEEIVKSLEKTIKDNLLSEYERKVQKEQQQRSAAVIAGAAPSLRSGKPKKNRKHSEKNEPKKDLKKEAELFVEAEFQDLQLHGRIRFRRMLKMVGKVLKKHPEMFKKDNQRGSHHVLHVGQGGATLVQTHGRHDNTMSPYMAKRFMKKIMDQVNQTLTGKAPE